MIDKKIEAIINEEIEGTASDRDSAWLKEVLATDEEARAYYEDLQRLSGLLSDVREVDPPPELKENIMRGVQAIAATRHPATPLPEAEEEGWISSIRSLFARPLRPAYAMTFAAGLAVGVFVFALLTSIPSGFESGSLTGVMAPRDDYEALTVADTVPFDADRARGVLETRYSGNLILAKIEVDSPEEIEILTRFEDTILNPLGFRKAEPGPGDVFQGPNELRIRHLGRNSYWLVFENKEATPSLVHFEIRSGGEVFETQLKTGAENS